MSNKKLFNLLKLSESPYILAPMFQVNDLAFRLMCREHHINICYTGMINSHMWVFNKNERPKMFETGDKDRPLVIQLNGNDEKEFIECAKDVEKYADAIDINLGCTQRIAKRGRYGFFMVNNEEKRQNTIEMVKNIVKSINVPLTAKIRLFNDDDGNVDVKTTVDFAKSLEAAGVAMIEIHGRIKKLNKAGDVNMDVIKEIVNSVSVPVIGNGGIASKEEADNMIKETGVAGVMIGQALLNNPRLIDEPNADPVELAREYLKLNNQYPIYDFTIAKRHIYNFFEQKLSKTSKIADELKKVHTQDDAMEFLDKYCRNEII